MSTQPGPGGQSQPYGHQPYGDQPQPYGSTQHPQPYGSTQDPQPHAGTHPVPYGLNPGYQQQAAAIAVLGKKSSGLAAVLSLLLVGAGQMYCGRVGRGLAFLGGYVVSVLLMFVVIGFLLAPVVFIWALVDAINLANRHNAELLQRLTFGQTFH